MSNTSVPWGQKKDDALLSVMRIERRHLPAAIAADEDMSDAIAEHCVRRGIMVVPLFIDNQGLFNVRAVVHQVNSIYALDEAGLSIRQLASFVRPAGLPLTSPVAPQYPTADPLAFDLDWFAALAPGVGALLDSLERSMATTNQNHQLANGSASPNIHREAILTGHLRWSAIRSLHTLLKVLPSLGLSVVDIAALG
ncbi:hypothetical protein EK21DRAFT_112691 [Setomelanomma holmii]|uniref:Uncharacterized protein n=1 Tax=Setomelanomma holmii TaxID=210430 RepID=A0A9P4H8G1_9PLEO|nr:hypothetical protein EK21DRAFT_112691 [Setomelanomma holmii]